jgi:hypothetical protein
LILFIKGLKESWGLLPWTFALGFGGFFGLCFFLGAFWCGKLLEGKRITEGKRTAGELLKEKNG